MDWNPKQIYKLQFVLGFKFSISLKRSLMQIFLINSSLNPSSRAIWYLAGYIQITGWIKSDKKEIFFKILWILWITGGKQLALIVGREQVFQCVGCVITIILLAWELFYKVKWGHSFRLWLGSDLSINCHIWLVVKFFQMLTRNYFNI